MWKISVNQLNKCFKPLHPRFRHDTHHLPIKCLLSATFIQIESALRNEAFRFVFVINTIRKQSLKRISHRMLDIQTFQNLPRAAIKMQRWIETRFVYYLALPMCLDIKATLINQVFALFKHKVIYMTSNFIKLESIHAQELYSEFVLLNL